MSGISFVLTDWAQVDVQIDIASGLPTICSWAERKGVHPCAFQQLLEIVRNS
jgi:hypothetical protein